MIMEILGIPLYDKGMERAIEEVITVCKDSPEKENRCISATGGHGLVISKEDPVFRDILKSFYMNLPDGKPGAVVGKWKGAREMTQCTGPDFFMNLMKATAQSKIRHYFCGGKEGVPEALKKACEEKFDNHNVVGCYSPPFRQMTQDEMQRLGKDMDEARADIVWIGLSTPKQEFFAHALRKHARVHFIVTVGAAFDFHSGNLKKAPRYVQNMGFEWLYRLIMEPKRMWKRDRELLPKYSYYLMQDLYNHIFIKRK